MPSNGAKEGTRKHNYIPNLQASNLHLSFNHIYSPRVGRQGESQEHAGEKGGLGERVGPS